ncbi:MAG TPA: hypothetical protein VJT16_04670 [Streptosporangiaceae bacterium]|nr:hypothetical protein [Streptosporangiaceae bacterium]
MQRASAAAGAWTAERDSAALISLIAPITPDAVPGPDAAPVPLGADDSRAPTADVRRPAAALQANLRRTSRWLSSRPEYVRMIRGALLTPWFAVSVGIVIATSLTLARPHPALTFPAPKTGRCAVASCSSPSAPPAVPSPAIKHGARLPVPRSDANVRVTGVKVEYEVMSGPEHGFIAVIVVKSRRQLGDWELSFSLPGASIDHVMWAEWRHRGADGIVVVGSPLPWGQSRDNEARIIIFGTGRPERPTRCELDGGSCTFRAMPKQAGRSRDFTRLRDQVSDQGA